MGGALHSEVACAGASFALDRLEIVDGRLVVRGWWFGVRGVRFMRPGLVVDGRRVLATLEHKPWAVAEDGAWTAAFEWTRGLDVGGVTLVVAPSIEVPLDRDADPPDPAPVLREVGIVPAAPVTVVREVREPLREELEGIERDLDAMHGELHDARARAAEREERCRELEQAVARERRAAGDAEVADDEIVRAHAMAVLDRDRALAQHAEAVSDREAAVRARKRMERQLDEAHVVRSQAEARRDEALAERDEARRQRDELLLVYQALRAQRNGPPADAVRMQPLPAPRNGAPADAARTQPLTAVESPDVPGPPAADPPRRKRTPSVAPREGAAGSETPIGVRTIPAARTIAPSLHRSQRERMQSVTRYDMWAIRILGSVAALAFISLLLMILKAFFVF